jgi:hypothetical protein
MCYSIDLVKESPASEQQGLHVKQKSEWPAAGFDPTTSKLLSKELEGVCALQLESKQTPTQCRDHLCENGQQLDEFRPY